MSAFLEVTALSKQFPARDAQGREALLTAVDGVSFSIEQGKTLGLVGESGCGKSTLARCILRLIEPSSGSVRLDGIDLTKLSRRELRGMRRRMQIIFQDPVGSLNPRMTVGAMLREPLFVHGFEGDRESRVIELLDRVGLSADALGRYPHEFSGGQRQRIGIARALSVEPELIIADEPVSSLDVSVQAQVVNLLMDLQKSLGLTYMCVAHDLNLIRHISDRVAVMYLGRFVEWGPVAAVYERPAHPYTRALLAATPQLHGDVPDNPPLLGEPPSPVHPPSGCHFHPRCPIAEERCKTEKPLLRVIGQDHQVACHLA